MFNLLFIMSIIGNVVQLVKETHTPVVPAENWANKELYYKDIIDGVSVEQRIKNLENGKYLRELGERKYSYFASGNAK